MIPKLSIIIPCFNTESTLEETLKSVLNQNFTDWEAIIVNDGSKDNLEEIALKWVDKDIRFKYFKKENGGLGTARNFGILNSKGTYILPLDSDNLVRPDFAQSAIRVFENDTSIGVVHGNANYFGDKSGLWEIEEFNYAKILKSNYIDACAIFKKEYWIKAKGYDEKMPYQGNEDWELWLAFGKLGVKFHHLAEITFDYRVTQTSMINSFSREMFEKNRAYISKKYKEQYNQYPDSKNMSTKKYTFKNGILFFYKKIRQLIHG